MGGILDKLDEWLRGLLVEGITGNLSGMFDTVNTKVGEIAGEVGQTPQGWNSGVFSMIQNLSETVIVPIAGVILTFVMCYELIQLVTEKNNLHDIDTWMFFKWIFKTFCAVLIVTNTWNIVMGVLDVAQSVVNSSAGVIIGNTSIDINSVITDMEGQLEALSTGELFGLWFQSLFVGLTMNALSICIMLVIYGRMIEVYLTTSIGPIPLATMTNRDWGTTGQNYLRSLFALGFQAFLIMVCVGIYSVLVQGSGISEEGQKLFAPEKEIIGYCPRCGKPVYEGKKNFACSDRACSFVLWKQDRFWTSRKKELTKKMAADLLKRGRTAVKGLWSEKRSSTYDAVVVMEDTSGRFIKFKMEFPKQKK